jgi:Family of unknown function (DUF6516)
MNAESPIRERHQIRTDAFVELLIWRVPGPVRGSTHYYKYALAYVVAGQCVIQYDNEAGKGDHKHFGGMEKRYAFTTPANLLADFWFDVDQWRLA